MDGPPWPPADEPAEGPGDKLAEGPTTEAVCAYGANVYAEQWILRRFPKIVPLEYKDAYATHFRQQHQRWSYHRVVRIPDLHDRILAAKSQGVPNYTNETMTPVTRFCLDVDGGSVHDPLLADPPAAHAAGDGEGSCTRVAGPSVLQFLQVTLHTLFPTTDTYCVVLDASGPTKRSQHLHWPLLFLRREDCGRVARHLQVAAVRAVLVQRLRWLNSGSEDVASPTNGTGPPPPNGGTLAVVLWALGWGDGLLGASSSTRAIRIASPSEWSGDPVAVGLPANLLSTVTEVLAAPDDAVGDPSRLITQDWCPLPDSGPQRRAFALVAPVLLASFASFGPDDPTARERWRALDGRRRTALVAGWRRYLDEMRWQKLLDGSVFQSRKLRMYLADKWDDEKQMPAGRSLRVARITDCEGAADWREEDAPECLTHRSALLLTCLRSPGYWQRDPAPPPFCWPSSPLPAHLAPYSDAWVSVLAGGDSDAFTDPVGGWLADNASPLHQLQHLATGLDLEIVEAPSAEGPVLEVWLKGQVLVSRPGLTKPVRHRVALDALMILRPSFAAALIATGKWSTDPAPSSTPIAPLPGVPGLTPVAVPPDLHPLPAIAALAGRLWSALAAGHSPVLTYPEGVQRALLVAQVALLAAAAVCPCRVLHVVDAEHRIAARRRTAVYREWARTVPTGRDTSNPPLWMWEATAAHVPLVDTAATRPNTALLSFVILDDVASPALRALGKVARRLHVPVLAFTDVPPTVGPLRSPSRPAPGFLTLCKPRVASCWPGGIVFLTDLRSLDDALYLVRAELVGLLAQPPAPTSSWSPIPAADGPKVLRKSRSEFHRGLLWGAIFAREMAALTLRPGAVGALARLAVAVLARGRADLVAGPEPFRAVLEALPAPAAELSASALAAALAPRPPPPPMPLAPPLPSSGPGEEMVVEMAAQVVVDTWGQSEAVRILAVLAEAESPRKLQRSVARRRKDYGTRVTVLSAETPDPGPQCLLTVTLPPFTPEAPGGCQVAIVAGVHALPPAHRLPLLHHLLGRCDPKAQALFICRSPSEVHAVRAALAAYEQLLRRWASDWWDCDAVLASLTV